MGAVATKRKETIHPLVWAVDNHAPDVKPGLVPSLGSANAGIKRISLDKSSADSCASEAFRIPAAGGP
ncbi:hypothetical protein NDU88_000366 [Pleurodeles waltl]|uniref:Uncharacterized protein n=1 Tax=Pleurodeles waltl TaxID=8319 RepID=A0AAV7U6X4_PLEWA|nr:hypothetical protein NDU88_000366 [Pleurodeles waltl]